MASLELEARLDNLLAINQTETANIDIFAPIEEREECPICLLPLPIDDSEIRFMACCGKMICMGCICKHVVTETKNGVQQHDHKCIFCRQLMPKNSVKAMKKLMKKNNPHAHIQMANRYKEGDGVIQSYTKTLEMYVDAAELGHADAYAGIGLCYKEGIAVERNMSKAFYFLEVGAKKGSIVAQKLLASFHLINANSNEGIEHLKVAAYAGDQDSMDTLMKLYKAKVLSKDDLTQILRAFQTSYDEMKSKDRDDAREKRKSFKQGNG